MEESQSPPIRAFFPLVMLLAFPGWFWLIYLMTRTVPTLGNRWMFFAAVVLTMTGSSLPLIAYLNRIIKPFGTATYETVVREATLLGIYCGFLLWLNTGQVLSWGLAIILAIGVVLIDLMLRLRSRSQWHPED